MSFWIKYSIVAVVLVLAVLARADKSPRDPFWPVGYSPSQPKEAVPEAVPTLAVASSNVVVVPVEPLKPDPLVIEKLAAELQIKIRAQCQVSGFWKSSGGQQMAIVNGQIKGVGDKLSLSVDGQSYHFKVTAISAVSVKMEPVN